MSRHNRRRTRGGRKHSAARNRFADSHAEQFEDNAGVALPVPAFGQTPVRSFGSVIPDVIAHIPATPQREPHPRGLTMSARVWHNRYIAWQHHDRKQKEEKARLEIEKARIFGISTWDGDTMSDGSEDDDRDGLEEKMLEYFGGLEWLHA